jgi:hypothetical protein
MIPKCHDIKNTKDLEKEGQLITDTLNDTTKDWQKRIKQIKMI